jgi:hypothetical protein
LRLSRLFLFSFGGLSFPLFFHGSDHLLSFAFSRSCSF